MSASIGRITEKVTKVFSVYGPSEDIGFFKDKDELTIVAIRDGGEFISVVIKSNENILKFRDRINEIVGE